MSDGPAQVAGLPSVASDPAVARPPFAFSKDDEKFLDEVQHGAFNFFWNAGSPALPGHATGMVPDRTSKPTVSVAGVGFQLSALCIGVERRWITRDQGRERAELILRKLSSTPMNRKGGLFYHFVDAETAGQPPEAYERVVSTIDSALLLSGILTASQYFGGEVQRLGDALFTDADWRFFVCGPEPDPEADGFISLGWKPEVESDPIGKGGLLPYAWIDAGDEHRLVTFLGVCAPDPKKRVDPQMYYRLRRTMGTYAGSEFVWFPWSGALFTAFFSHCWIDYRAFGIDNPAAFGVERRPAVDWWENSRRTVLMHRGKAIENPRHMPTLGPNAWGLTASDVKDGYGVPGVFPKPAAMAWGRANVDYAAPANPAKDDYGDGTVAPYGAGSSIMFTPDISLSALRYYRSLKKSDGSPLVWSDPGAGGYGFFDAFNLGTGWVGSDCLAIDQGPLLLGIENARTGFVWRTFRAHRFVKDGMARLGMKPTPAPITTKSPSGR